MTPLQVLLVDDHPAVRDGLRVALGVEGTITVIGEVATAAAAVRACRESRPDVIIVDLSLPDARGAAVVRLLATAAPGVGMLVLSGSGDPQTVQDCLRAGARGYLLKTTSASDIRAAVVRAAAGERVVDPRLIDGLLTSSGAADLTPRELSVLDAISRGLTNRQVAKLLGLSESTVKTHLARSMTKLGAADRTQAVASLLRRGLLD